MGDGTMHGVISSQAERAAAPAGRKMGRALGAAAAVVLAFTLAPTDARALLIDFRDLPFETSANFDTSYTRTVSGVGDVTLSAAPSGATLYWDATDGFGVRYSYEVDEVESDERLILTFDDGPVQLNTIYLTDLFNEGYLETGSYSLDGGAWVYFTADSDRYPSPSTNGEKTLDLGGTLVSSVVFRAPGQINCDIYGRNCENHEYSLAGVDVKTRIVGAPEPGTLILMGSGLMGLALWRRRRESRDA